MKCDKTVIVRWQRSTATWIITGAIGFRRHKTKKPAVTEAKDLCKELAREGWVTQLTIHNRNGGMSRRIYP